MARITVNHTNFLDCITLIERNPYKRRALDTETTGLKAYLGDRLFSIIISTLENDYYFNFNTRPDNTGAFIPYENILPKSWLDDFKPMLEDPKNTWYLHNAKFDLHMLAQDGLFIGGTIYCTQSIARLIYNRLPSLKLSKVAELIGHKKDDKVEAYIMKHKLYTDVDVGKKKPKRNKHFDLVPFNLISEYGLTDGRVTFELGEYELNRIEELKQEQLNEGLPCISGVFNNEVELTNTLFYMEQTGVKVDIDYIKEAYNYEKESAEEYAAKFEGYTGIEFNDSPTCFKEAFKKLGLESGKTPLGNDSYSEENLPKNAVTELILGYRKHNKRAGTYFRNYLDLADENDVIHCNFRQDGTVTGRMSANEPNLQNVPKRGEDESKYPVRKCFIPRDGYFFIMVDFDQMEYRLLLDIAGESELIARIKEGLCVHTATAEGMGTEREAAKTLNFMLLYGGGAAKLAAALKIAIKKAKELKLDYFKTLKFVSALVKALTDTAKRRGFIVNWLGRRLYLDTNRPYTMPNHYIQGGCGDVVKMAMNKISKVLKPYKSNMLLQIHDELLIEMKYGEEDLIPDILKIMETTYPQNSLPLTAGVDFSNKNWFDKIKYKHVPKGGLNG